MDDHTRACASGRRVAALAAHLHLSASASSEDIDRLLRSSIESGDSQENGTPYHRHHHHQHHHDSSSGFRRHSTSSSSTSPSAAASGGNFCAVVVAPEVAAALASGHAVVALESTIVSHGMPYPENLTMAREVEAVVREHGAVPATIAIMDGVPRVGLSDEHLERLAKMGGDAAKVSRRDVASVVARGATGATTVSATMLLAERAGIAVFVTGEVCTHHSIDRFSMVCSLPADHAPYGESSPFT